MAIFRWPRHGLDSCWILAEYLIVDAFLLINPRCCILWIMSGFVWFQFLNSKSFCEICAFPQTALCEVQPLSWQAWALVSKTSLFPRKTSTKSIGWVLVPDFPGSQSEKESSLFYYLGPLSIHLHHRFCSQSTAAIVNCQFIFCSLQWTEDSPDEELQQHDSGPQPGWCWKWGPPQIHKSKELDLNPGDDKHLFVHKMDYTVSFIKKTSIRKSGFFSHWWMGFSWRKHVFIGCRWIPASWRHPRIYPQKGSWRDLHVVGGGWRCWCFASLSNHATGRRFFRISHQLTIGYHWFISYELGCPPSQFFVITRMTSDIFRLGDPKQPPTHLPGRGPTQHIMNKSKACWIPPRLRVQLLWLLWTFFGMSKRIGQLLKLKQKKHLTFAMLFFLPKFWCFFLFLLFFSVMNFHFMFVVDFRVILCTLMLLIKVYVAKSFNAVRLNSELSVVSWVSPVSVVSASLFPARSAEHTVCTSNGANRSLQVCQDIVQLARSGSWASDALSYVYCTIGCCIKDDILTNTWRTVGAWDSDAVHACHWKGRAGLGFEPVLSGGVACVCKLAGDWVVSWVSCRDG